MDKVNAELVTLTYGTIVSQLCQDYDSDYHEVNKQLDKMGYNIGMRLIEDFLAKSNMGRCANFRETADTISKVGYFYFDAFWMKGLFFLAAADRVDPLPGRIQDLPQHHAQCHELDE